MNKWYVSFLQVPRCRLPKGDGDYVNVSWHLNNAAFSPHSLLGLWDLLLNSALWWGIVEIMLFPPETLSLSAICLGCWAEGFVVRRRRLNWWISGHNLRRGVITQVGWPYYISHYTKQPSWRAKLSIHFRKFLVNDVNVIYLKEKQMVLLLNAGACPKKINLSAGGPQHVCDASVCMCLVLSPVCVNMLLPSNS